MRRNPVPHPLRRPLALLGTLLLAWVLSRALAKDPPAPVPGAPDASSR